MINANTPTNEAYIRDDRQSITHEWVSAQVRSNANAGLGVACMLLPVILVSSLLLGFDYVSVFFGVLLCASVGVLYFGWLQFNRFSLDEWVESGKRTELVMKNQELRDELDELREELNAKNILIESLQKEELHTQTRVEITNANTEKYVASKLTITNDKYYEAGKWAAKVFRQWATQTNSSNPDAYAGVQIWSRDEMNRLNMLTPSQWTIAMNILEGAGVMVRKSRKTVEWIVKSEGRARALIDAHVSYLRTQKAQL